MKNILVFIGIAAVVVIVVFIYREQNGGLKTQLLGGNGTQPEITEVSDCLKKSENSANDCLMQLALDREDVEFCEEITKAGKKRECEREVELSQ